MSNLGTALRRPDRRVWTFVVLGCALGMSSLSGCSAFSGDKKKAADPLLGEVHPQNNSPYGPVPPPPSEKKTNAETTGQKTSANAPADPLFGPSSTSNAFLAGLTKPLPGSQPLAIGDGRSPTQFQLTSNSEPVVRSIPKDPAFVNGSWASQPPKQDSTTQGQFVAQQPGNFVDPQTSLLQGRGVTQHRVDPQPDGTVRLIAVAPQRGNPSQVRTYDVAARDFPAAVQAVLEQMDRGQ